MFSIKDVHTSSQDQTSAWRPLRVLCVAPEISLLSQRERIGELEARIESLLNERDTLKGRIQQLKVGPCISFSAKPRVSPAQCTFWEGVNFSCTSLPVGQS